MLKIRLQRTGRKNDPAFRVVLTDSKNSTKSGKFNEVLGNYNARAGKAELKKDRIVYWLSVGAKTSTTIHNILVNNKIVEGKKKNALPKRKPVAESEKKTEEVVNEIKTETTSADVSPELMKDKGEDIKQEEVSEKPKE